MDLTFALVLFLIMTVIALSFLFSYIHTQECILPISREFCLYLSYVITPLQDYPAFLPLMGTEFNILCLPALHFITELLFYYCQLSCQASRSLGKTESILWEHLKPAGQCKCYLPPCGPWQVHSVTKHL